MVLNLHLPFGSVVDVMVEPNLDAMPLEPLGQLAYIFTIVPAVAEKHMAGRFLGTFSRRGTIGTLLARGSHCRL
jgi:hypothetical protein